MAIRINNTIVINDSRELANITNLKTINGESILGTGNIQVGGGISPTQNAYSDLTVLQTLTSPLSSAIAFGSSTSIDGNYAIVGSVWDEDPNSQSGRAYIYELTSATENKLLHVLNNPNSFGTSATDRFGEAVAIKGRYAAVGAPGENNIDSGTVYIFDVITGGLLLTIPCPVPAVSADFGTALSISHSRIAIGAPGYANGSGRVFIYELFTGRLLREIANPNINGSADYDRFGLAISLTKNRLICGAHEESASFIGGNQAGKVYVFDIHTAQSLYTLNPNIAGDLFGYDVAAVDVEGQVEPLILASAPYNDTGGSNAGRAYLYNGNTLLHILANPTPGTNDNIGFGIALSEKYALVLGASSGQDFRGEIIVYEVSSGNVVKIFNEGILGFSSSANCLSISGNYCLLGNRIYNKAILIGLDDIFNMVNVENIKFTNARTLDSRNLIFESAEAPCVLTKTFNNPNVFSTSDGDWFGYSVATDGNYIAIGAPFEDATSNTDSGKVYIFENVSGRLVRTIDNPNAVGTNFAGGDEFGYSVSVFGNYVLVGAYREDINSQSASGAAYLFEINTGRRIRTFTDPSPVASGQFGTSVVLNGSYAIIGCPRGTVSGAAAGKTFVFNIRTGALVHTLLNPEPNANDFFGFSVAASSNFIVVSAYGDSTTISLAGKVYVYDATSGILLHTLTSTTPINNGFFGISVAVNNRYCAVGAPGEGASFQSGKVYVYDLYNNAALEYTLQNPNNTDSGGFDTPNGDNFGYYVALSDNYLAVSVPYEDFTNSATNGRVYVYNLNHEMPSNVVPSSGAPFRVFELNYQGNITNVQQQNWASSYFGWSINISKDDYLIVGAYGTTDWRASGTSSGRAYLFSLNNKSFLDKAAIV